MRIARAGSGVSTAGPRDWLGYDMPLAAECPVRPAHVLTVVGRHHGWEVGAVGLVDQPRLPLVVALGPPAANLTIKVVQELGCAVHRLVRPVPAVEAGA